MNKKNKELLFKQILSETLNEVKIIKNKIEAYPVVMDNNVIIELMVPYEGKKDLLGHLISKNENYMFSPYKYFIQYLDKLGIEYVRSHNNKVIEIYREYFKIISPLLNVEIYELYNQIDNSKIEKLFGKRYHRDIILDFEKGDRVYINYNKTNFTCRNKKELLFTFNTVDELYTKLNSREDITETFSKEWWSEQLELDEIKIIKNKIKATVISVEKHATTISLDISPDDYIHGYIFKTDPNQVEFDDEGAGSEIF